jgi:hypothetical protein
MGDSLTVTLSLPPVPNELVFPGAGLIRLATRPWEQVQH